MDRKTVEAVNREILQLISIAECNRTLYGNGAVLALELLKQRINDAKDKSNAVQG